MKLERIKGFFLPLAGHVTMREKFAAAITSFLGMLTVTYITQVTTGTHGLVYLAVSMGSATVLLFAAPHAPMAQPWPLLGGNLISALIGVVCYQYVNNITLAAALAVSLSIFAMYMLRCMNPPGGAAALGAVLGGEQIHALGFEYVLMPIGVNILVIFIVALIVNNLFPGRRYPLSPLNPDKIKNKDVSKFCCQRYLEERDIDFALASLNTYIDTDRRDLSLIFQLAEMNAMRRRTGPVSCYDLMSQPVAVSSADTLAAAGSLMAAGDHDTLAVIDDERNYLASIDRKMLNGFDSSAQQGTVGDLLINGNQRDRLFVKSDEHIVDSLPLFNQSGQDSLPVVSGEGRLLGMLSRDRVTRELIKNRLF